MIPKEVQEVKKYLISLFNKQESKDRFEAIDKIEDTYKRAKEQEDFIISNSNSKLVKANEDEKINHEKDLKFGDIKDKFENYYDLKVGKPYAGSITYKSIRFFGETYTDTHWYICTNTQLTKLYLINARLLFKMFVKTKKNFLYWSKDKLEASDAWIGEKEYSNYPFVYEIDLKGDK